MRNFAARNTVVALLIAFVLSLVPHPVRAQPDRIGPFLGTWCAQGDPAKRTSISANGPFLTLTNEQGSTSSGHIAAGGEIIAPQWSLVRGTLSSGGSRISWSNGTFWERCNSNHSPLSLQGTWYMGGNRSKPCYIDQRGGSLSLRNESGQVASGSFTGTHTITTTWFGTTITGTISRDRISWSNGTYWTR